MSDLTVKEIFDTMTEDEKLASLIFITELADKVSVPEIKHSDELKHYGVMGMKWGKRKAKSYAFKSEVHREEATKQQAKADSLKSKALSVDAKNQKKLYKLQKKELKARMKGQYGKMEDIARDIMKVNMKSQKLRYKAAKLESKIYDNNYLADKYSQKVDKTLAKHAAKYKKEMDELMKDKELNSDKIHAMKKQYEIQGGY